MTIKDNAGDKNCKKKIKSVILVAINSPNRSSGIIPSESLNSETILYIVYIPLAKPIKTFTTTTPATAFIKRCLLQAITRYSATEAGKLSVKIRIQGEKRDDRLLSSVVKNGAFSLHSANNLLRIEYYFIRPA